MLLGAVRTYVRSLRQGSPQGNARCHVAFFLSSLQRGDAEYSQKLWRVVRSCVELGDKNPIVQIHDQVWGHAYPVPKVVVAGCASARVAPAHCKKEIVPAVGGCDNVMMQRA